MPDPQRLFRKIQRLFDAAHRREGEWSERWSLHANRRTTVVMVVAGIAAALLYTQAIAPPDSFPAGALVSVPEGETVPEVAQTLARQNVIRSPLMFRLFLRLMGRDRSARAGDYVFKRPVSVFSVARAVAAGEFGLEPIRIRIPEGATTQEMARVFPLRLERFDAANFLAQAAPQEGYLFPDTYFFLPNATEDTVIRAMRQNFDQQIASIAPEIASSTRSLEEIVTMASILEREAYNTRDRRMIAGVLWNRIERGMPLQVDAVFFYTLGKGTFDLTMKDLTTPSPYNTYINKGLPPTAIGSPSLDSLRAAADPIESEYLFFLADKRGVTHYCEDYACQLANKRRYF